MAEQELIVENFLVERPDPLKMPEVVGCIDDRPMHKVGLYSKHAGGPDGFGRDLATGQEADRPGTFIRNNRPVHRLSLVTHRLLRGFGTEAFMHWGCASFGEAVAIDELVINEPDKVFERIRVFSPQMPRSRFDRIHDAKFHLLSSGLILPRALAESDMRYHVEEPEMALVSHRHLVDSPHKASDFVIDHGVRALWDTRAAWRAGTPAYYWNGGIMSDIVFNTIKDSLPPEVSGVKPQTFKDAARTRHAAASLVLEKATGVEFTFHHRTD